MVTSPVMRCRVQQGCAFSHGASLLVDGESHVESVDSPPPAGTWQPYYTSVSKVDFFFTIAYVHVGLCQLGFQFHVVAVVVVVLGALQCFGTITFQYM